MSPGTRVEFYADGHSKYMAAIDGVGAVPPEGSFVSVRGELWIVVRLTWAVDSADWNHPRLRARVDVERPQQKPDDD